MKPSDDGVEVVIERTRYGHGRDVEGVNSV